MRYAALEAYVPGEQPRDKAYIKLNTNESPYPPSPEVIASVNAAAMEELRLYSDPTCRLLRRKIADRCGVSEENVFLSNGSDDILNFAFMAFGEKGAVFPDITYGFYSVFAALHGVPTRVMPLREDFTVDPADYLTGGRLTVLANPNAPTGLALPLPEIERIVAADPDRVVVIDEAYVDFGAESALSLLPRYDNLLIVRTFSKSRSMAGARLGFALADKALIDDLEKIKYSTNPYNINRLTQLAGAAAIDSDEYFAGNCRRICRTRERTTASLKELGFTVLPSMANFVFASSDQIGGEELYRRLKERGILVRHFDKDRIREYNRITIGSEDEMDRLIAAVKSILS